MGRDQRRDPGLQEHRAHSAPELEGPSFPPSGQGRFTNDKEVLPQIDGLFVS